MRVVLHHFLSRLDAQQRCGVLGSLWDARFVRRLRLQFVAAEKNMRTGDTSCVMYDRRGAGRRLLRVEPSTSLVRLPLSPFRVGELNAFGQTSRRVGDVAGAGEKTSGQPSLALSFATRRPKAELTSAHSRVTPRHRLHHYPENQSVARRRAAGRPRWCKPESRSIHRYENAARWSHSPRRPRRRGVRDER